MLGKNPYSEQHSCSGGDDLHLSYLARAWQHRGSDVLRWQSAKVPSLPFLHGGVPSPREIGDRMFGGSAVQCSAARPLRGVESHPGSF